MVASAARLTRKLVIAMPTARRALLSLTPRRRGVNLSRWLAAARVLALALLFLLPMQMRAGADDPHAHAMLHLLLDARDGLVDHHDEDEYAVEHDGHGSPAGGHEPDVPHFGSSHVAGGATAMLAALVVMFLLPTGRRLADWAASPLLNGLLPVLEPPPPRVAIV